MRKIEYCFICGNVAREQDHFPVPVCMGGKNTHPICRGCHDEVDRTPLLDWQLPLAFEALTNLWEKATVRERLVIAKLIKVTAHAIHTSRMKRKTRGR